MRTLFAVMLICGSLHGQTATFSVSENNFAYFIDDAGPNPPIQLFKDSTYAFRGAAIPSDHPFAISTSSSVATVPPGTSPASITGNQTLLFTPSTTGTFFYVCTFHFFFGEITVIDAPTTSTGAQASATPSSFAMHPPYPNPFNPSSHISFDLPERSDIQLTIVNTLGQEVGTIMQGTYGPGTHRATWNASAPTGVYYWKLEAASLDSEKRIIATQRTVLLR